MPVIDGLAIVVPGKGAFPATRWVHRLKGFAPILLDNNEVSRIHAHRLHSLSRVLLVLDDLRKELSEKTQSITVNTVIDDNGITVTERGDSQAQATEMSNVRSRYGEIISLRVVSVLSLC